MNILSIIEQSFGEWLDVENKTSVLALFVVIKFFAVVGFVGLLVWTIRRNAAKECPSTSRLLDELEQRETGGGSDSKRSGEKDSAAADQWERDPDWWKK